MERRPWQGHSDSIVGYQNAANPVDSRARRPLESSGSASVFFWGLGRYGAHDHSSSGNRVIDAQHQRLSEYADILRAMEFSKRPVAEVNAIVDALVQDLDQHFRDEEAILADSSHPDAAQHAALHRELLNSAATLVGQLRAGASSIGELFRFLVDDVLTKHMDVADRECISYMGSQH